MKEIINPPMSKYLNVYLSKCLIVSLLVCLSACEKDIDLDYHQVDPIYVVEASISNSGTEIRISRTNNMDDNNGISDVTGTKVTISDDEGNKWNIPYSRNGFHRMSSLMGEPGTTYNIDVEIEGNHYTSTSTMQRQPKMNSFRFVWMKVASERIMFGDLKIQDIPNEDNWYYMHIYRNGIGYRWALLRDDRNPNKELQQLFSFFHDGRSDDSDVLKEGDRLRILIRAIDQRAYDYLYSLQLMDNTGTNPIPNFTGGCLGYFSAYNQITEYVTYHEADVEEE